jgi:hypothetical protein
MDSNATTQEIIDAMRKMLDDPTQHEELATNLRELHEKSARYDLLCERGHWNAMDRKWVVRGMTHASAGSFDAAVTLLIKDVVPK